MAQRRVLSSFVVTLGVLAVIVAFSLRNATATVPTSSPETTLVAYHPVAGMNKQGSAAVHIVNLGRDTNAPSEVFRVMFINAAGQLIIPEQQCDVKTGETCTVWLLGKDCGIQPKGRCQFRAVVVGQAMSCPTPDLGTGDWMTNLELVDNSGDSTVIAGENQNVLKLPTDSCSSVDASVPPTDAFIPNVDAPPPPPDAPSIDALPPTDVP